MDTRKNTRKVYVGNIPIGGLSDITVQSMCNTDTRDIDKTIVQIKALEDVGCDIVRVAVPDMQAAESLEKIVKNIKIPLVADIHFDYRLALVAIKSGISKLRINPGNIGSEENVRKLVEAAKERKIPIRIGVNSGSIEKELIDLYNKNHAEAMVESALRHIKILEQENFEDIVISLKSSNINDTVEAYKLLSSKCDYPLHIGITEAGTTFSGTIKSAIGIGILLNEGIGDTIRVSITGDPIQEVLIGKEILKVLGLRKEGVEIISCPTCGRCEINLEKLALDVEKYTSNIKKPLKIAVMGCVVNGPGEARDADLGIAGGKKEGLIFIKGKIYKKVREENLLEEFIKILDNYLNNG